MRLAFLAFLCCVGACLHIPPLRRTVYAASNACEWTTVDRRCADYIMHRYFDCATLGNRTCEVFLIEGVPACSILHRRTNERDMPVVDSFHVNEAMMLLFDAGPTMRATFYDRYKHATTRDALNLRCFLNS